MEEEPELDGESEKDLSIMSEDELKEASESMPVAYDEEGTKMANKFDEELSRRLSETT